jgi:hypothetical protein
MQLVEAAVHLENERIGAGTTFQQDVIAAVETAADLPRLFPRFLVSRARFVGP